MLLSHPLPFPLLLLPPPPCSTLFPYTTLFRSVLGRLVEVTGGAQVLADKMLDTFGERRAPLALAVAYLFYAFPIFLDAGFIVMLPVIYTVARRLGGSFMLYVLPSIASFMMMHALLPPHPGPTAAATVMGADGRSDEHT